MRRIGLMNCPYCGSGSVYASKLRTLWETVAILFLLRPVRCHVCMHRHYRPILLFVAKRPLSKNLRKESHNASGQSKAYDRSA
jgi:hypothetical protein